MSGGTRSSDGVMVENVEGKSATELYIKLNWLPMGSMIGMHQVMHLEEHEQDPVLMSLVVTKGSRKYSKSKEMLAKKWMWYSRENMVDMFNNETGMSEAIFKATYLEDEVKIADESKIAPENILPIVGVDWPKKVHHGKGIQVQLIKLIAKFMWQEGSVAQR